MTDCSKYTVQIDYWDNMYIQAPNGDTIDIWNGMNINEIVSKIHDHKTGFKR